MTKYKDVALHVVNHACQIDDDAKNAIIKLINNVHPESKQRLQDSFNGVLRARDHAQNQSTHSLFTPLMNIPTRTVYELIYRIEKAWSHIDYDLDPQLDDIEDDVAYCGILKLNCESNASIAQSEMSGVNHAMFLSCSNPIMVSYSYLILDFLGGHIVIRKLDDENNFNPYQMLRANDEDPNETNRYVRLSSVNNTSFISSDSNGLVRLWQQDEAQDQFNLTFEQDLNLSDVTNIQYLQANGFLTTSNEGLKLWAIQGKTCVCIQNFCDRSFKENSLTYFPHKKLLAIKDKKQVILARIQSDGLLYQEPVRMQHDTDVLSIAFSDSEECAVLTTDGVVTLWHLCNPFIQCTILEEVLGRQISFNSNNDLIIGGNGTLQQFGRFNDDQFRLIKTVPTTVNTQKLFALQENVVINVSQDDGCVTLHNVELIILPYNVYSNDVREELYATSQESNSWCNLL